MPALTETAIQELDDFLTEHCADNGGMLNVEMVDGFLSALAVCVETLSADEWLPEVLGEKSGFSPIAKATTVKRLLMALWEDVQRRVRQEPDAIGDEDYPLLAIPPNLDSIDPQSTEEFLALAWGMGFHHGLDLQADAWDRMCEAIDGLNEDIDQIGELMMIGDSEENSPAITLERRMEIIAMIPNFLSTLAAIRSDPAS